MALELTTEQSGGLQQVHHLFEVREREPGEMDAFLTNHPFLLPLLVETHQQLSDYFPGSTLAAELMSDPEEEHDSQHVVVYAVTGQSPDAALETLKRFDLEWWLGASDRSQNRVSIDVEIR